MIFKGAKGGGGGSFKQTPDNLRSEDTFEGVLGLCIGPIKGPTRGLKSVKIDGTALENETGEMNFSGFIAVQGNGDPAQFPQPIQLKLGAGAAPQQVGVSLTNPSGSAPGPWVTRTLNNTNADFIDLRFIASQLYRQDKNGVYNETATIELQMKPVGKTNWVNPSVDGSAGIVYNESGHDILAIDSGFVRVFLPREMFDAAGNFDGGVSLGKSTAYGGTNFRITGKTTSPAVYELRLSIPNTGPYADTAWDVRARLLERETLDADPKFEKRTLSWESMAAIYSDVLGTHEDWRGVAWMQLFGKASDQLTGVPDVTGEWDTKIVSVPSSAIFNSETRIYTPGVWDGSWTKGFTNDPAWVINDAISDPLAGLALMAPGSFLNKWDALESSKWCSTRVPDGNGGTEPRYSMNIAISNPSKAEEFVRYLAGAVGGLAWDQGDGEWRLKMDKPDTPVDIFTLDNIEGEFVYSHTDVDTRFNDITGQFKNKEMDYREDSVHLFDNPSIAKIGRKPTNIILVGATGRQEAMRRIKLRLRSTVNETRMVNFTTNRRGRNIEQLDLILVADGDLGDLDKRTTGRTIVVAPDRQSIVVRDPLRLETGVSYTMRFALQNPNYMPATAGQPTSDDWKKPTIVATRNVANTSGQRGNVTTIYLDAPLPEGLPDNLAIALEAPGLPTLPKLYRVTNVVYNDDGERVAISALEVDVGKWDASDNVSKQDTVFQDLRGPVPSPLLPPSSPLLSLIRTPAEQGTNVSLVANWVRPIGAFVSGFRVRNRINGGEWNTVTERTQFATHDFVNPVPGEWQVEITTLDRRGGYSQPLIGSMVITQALIDAAQITYNDGQTVEDLQPNEPGADVTGNNTSNNTENVGDRPTSVLTGQVDGVVEAIADGLVQLNDILVDVDALYATYGSTAAAASSASAAAAYASTAETARTAAETARTQSQTARDASISARDSAIVQANAASGHATTASSHKDTAAGSASASAASATAANSSAGNASTSASNAATSATNALGSANSAATSAITAASATTAATQQVASLLPDTFTSLAHWTSTASGLPTTVADATGTIVTDTDFGSTLEADGGISNRFHKGVLPIVPGRVYELRVRAKAVGAASYPANHRAIWVALNSSHTQLNGLFSAISTFSAANIVNEIVTLINCDTILVAQPTAKWLRTGFQIGSGATTQRTGLVAVRDVTAREAAAVSAAAAASSASSASASQTAAGSSASAAQTSATNANTAAGNAATSATNASTSATNAAGSASSAGTSSTNAATSATAAGGSATAAAGSASAASTSATLAGNSANAASASELSARLVAASLLPEDFREAGKYWSHVYTESPETKSSLATSPVSGYTFTTVSGIPIAQVVAASNAEHDLNPVGVLRVLPNRRYRMTARVRVTSGSGEIRIFAIGLLSSYALGAFAFNSFSLTQNTWTNIALEVDSNALINGTTGYGAGPSAYVRPMLRSINAQTWQTEYIRIEDITSEAAASASASAAATSASSAGVSQTAAGVSATSASTSANSASTQAGNASSSATAAASSAAAASSYAAAAQASAVLAVNVNAGALNLNPIFGDWPNPAALPSNWLNLYGGVFTFSRASGVNSSYAFETANTASNPAYINQEWPAGSGLSKVGPGYYVLEADVELISGSLVGAAFSFSLYNSSGTYLNDTANIIFATDKDINGNIPGAGVVGTLYRYRKLVRMTAATGAKGGLGLSSNWPGAGTLTAKTLRWHRALVRPASDMEVEAKRVVSLEATVSTQAGALAAIQGRTAAFWQTEVVAGIGNGATAFISARAETAPGVVSSTVAFGAREVHIFNSTSGGWRRALTVAGGEVIVSGSLTAEAGIFLGSGVKWRVALASKDFQVSDGQSVSFGVNLGGVPSFSFHQDNLAALAAGETYKTFADAPTATGFIARLRIITPGASGPINLTSDTTPGTGPTRQIERGANAESANGSYRYTIGGTVTVTPYYESWDESPCGNGNPRTNNQPCQ